MAFKFEKLKVWQKAVDLSDNIDQMSNHSRRVNFLY